MKKNFTNPEIKITLFNREAIRTDGEIAVGTPLPMDEVGPSGIQTNYNNAVNWFKTNGVDAGNIFSYKN